MNVALQLHALEIETGSVVGDIHLCSKELFQTHKCSTEAAQHDVDNLETPSPSTSLPSPISCPADSPGLIYDRPTTVILSKKEA